ncbi:hypothetical protein OKW47_004221 [Paraburkholderia atlantica]
MSYCAYSCARRWRARYAATSKAVQYIAPAECFACASVLIQNLEPGSRRKRDLLVARFTSEQHVAMWKAAKSLDHFRVAQRVLIVAFTALLLRKLFEEAQRLLLARERFIVLERKIRERAMLHAWQQPIGAARDHPLGGLQRLAVGRKGARRPAMAVARKLVQHDHERQRAQRRGLPCVELTRVRRIDQVAETVAQHRIDGVIALEPELALRAVLRRARCAEPAVENVARPRLERRIVDVERVRCGGGVRQRVSHCGCASSRRFRRTNQAGARAAAPASRYPPSPTPCTSTTGRARSTRSQTANAARVDGDAQSG